MRAPHETIFVLISDLYEGGVETEFMKRAATHGRVRRAVRDAAGAERRRRAVLQRAISPGSSRRIGVPAFACTPDKFPELMAAAIQRADLREFVAAAQAGGKR